MLVFAIGISCNLSAQFFSSKFSSKKRDPNIPTIIKADSMDFDLSKNIAVFSGNVQVDDVEMQIFCHKMIINFEAENKSSDSAKKDPKDPVKKKMEENPNVN